jgi:hypothetical protein
MGSSTLITAKVALILETKVEGQKRIKELELHWRLV